VADVEITAGDTRPSLASTLEDGDGVAVSLVGVVEVRFRMRSVATGLTVVDAAATVVAPASAGTVRYDWQAGDTAVPGRYQARFRADFGGGQVQSFPNAEDFIDVLIAEQVA